MVKMIGHMIGAHACEWCGADARTPCDPACPLHPSHDEDWEY